MNFTCGPRASHARHASPKTERVLAAPARVAAPTSAARRVAQKTRATQDRAGRIGQSLVGVEVAGDGTLKLALKRNVLRAVGRREGRHLLRTNLRPRNLSASGNATGNCALWRKRSSRRKVIWPAADLSSKRRPDRGAPLRGCFAVDHAASVARVRQRIDAARGPRENGGHPNARCGVPRLDGRERL